jgi:hypothetical protein
MILLPKVFGMTKDIYLPFLMDMVSHLVLNLGSYGHQAAGYSRINFPKVIDKSEELIKADSSSAIRKIFSEIHQGMTDDPNVDTHMSGTTVGLVLIYDDFLLCANVGDTRVVLVSDKGEGIAISVYFYLLRKVIIHVIYQMNILELLNQGEE